MDTHLDRLYCWKCRWFSARLEDTESVSLLRVSQTYRLPYNPGVAGKPFLWFAGSAVLLKWGWTLWKTCLLASMLWWW